MTFFETKLKSTLPVGHKLQQSNSVPKRVNVHRSDCMKVTMSLRLPKKCSACLLSNVLCRCALKPYAGAACLVVRNDITMIAKEMKRIQLTIDTNCADD